MHAAFYLRGGRKYVDEVLKWLETRALPLPVVDWDKKPLKPELMIFEGRINYNPLGTWEYIFPDYMMNEVLTTLKFHKPIRPATKKMKMAVKFLRLAMGYKKIPKFIVKEGSLYMPTEALEYVQIIPIGVKYDKIGHFSNSRKSYEAL